VDKGVENIHPVVALSPSSVRCPFRGQVEVAEDAAEPELGTTGGRNGLSLEKMWKLGDELGYIAGPSSGKTVDNAS